MQPVRDVVSLASHLEALHRDPSSASCNVAASLLADFGAMEDAGPQGLWSNAMGTSRCRRTKQRLTRRALGPSSQGPRPGLVTCEVGPDRIEPVRGCMTAALLLYLTSRSGQSAVRDLIMEDLWPDQLPQSALNSPSNAVLPSTLPGAMAGRRHSVRVCPNGSRRCTRTSTLPTGTERPFQRQAHGNHEPTARGELGSFHASVGAWPSLTTSMILAEDWRTRVHATYPRSLTQTTREPGDNSRRHR